MRITQEADYALRVCLALASAENPIGAPQLAEAFSVPPRSSSKILRKLLLAGIVNSTRGANGGFTLSKASEDITLLEIIEAVDGIIAIRHCLEDCHNCNFQKNKEECRFHQMFRELNSIIRTRLGSLSLRDMVSKEIPISDLTKRLF